MVRIIALVAIINIAILTALLLMIEGVASCILVARDVVTAHPVAERRHTQYDRDLGWSNIPNTDIPDMYGPGRSLNTNSQGFRNKKDFPTAIPEGKVRIVCSGDSFTLGYGVDDDDTWSSQLAAIDPRIECLNMGQGGYGTDQAYLWFKRDIGAIQHEFHLLAFITSDFSRMEHEKFLGFGKPRFDLEDDELVLMNVPVPRIPYRLPILLTIRNSIRDFRILQLSKQTWWKGESRVETTANDTSTTAYTETANSNTRSDAQKSKTQKILEKIFADLRDLNRQRSSQLILVHLPVESDYAGDSAKDWTEFIRTTAARLEIPLIDMVGAFQALPQEDAIAMFIRRGELNYLGAAGHYNEKGNRFAAQTIYAELQSHLP